MRMLGAHQGGCLDLLRRSWRFVEDFEGAQLEDRLAKRVVASLRTLQIPFQIKKFIDLYHLNKISEP